MTNRHHPPVDIETGFGSAQSMDIETTYRRDGVASPVAVIEPAAAAEHRSALEAAEAQFGPLHYRNKIHTLVPSAFELATLRAVLDVVEDLIGPDVLLYNSTYIIKEPGADAFVAWHQDLTYWGLSDDDAQVSMWLALAPASAESGCMEMLPGSHADGRRDHTEVGGDANVLLLGQRIAEVDSAGARHYPLAPGQASFHHGWTVHRSGPNRSEDRRIGLNVQYLAAHNRPASRATAALVLGEDRYGYFGHDEGAVGAPTDAMVERWHSLDATMTAGFQIDDV